MSIILFRLRKSAVEGLGLNRRSVARLPKSQRVSKRYLSGALDILAYCLMSTHYHTLARIKPQAVPHSVSAALQKLFISYTKAISHRFRQVGALFQGQFQSRPIADESYLVNLCVYIHTHPVKDGLVAAPENWDYSNYREWLGTRDGTLVNDYLATRRLPDTVRANL